MHDVLLSLSFIPLSGLAMDCGSVAGAEIRLDEEK